MKRTSEIKYAVASDNTVVVMRQLAYRDGVRDAVEAIRNFINASQSPEAITTAHHILNLIKRLSLIKRRRKYK